MAAVSEASQHVRGYGQLTSLSAQTLLSSIRVSDPDNAVQEVQTLNFNDISTGDTFKLTHNGVESALVTYSTDMSTDIDTALTALASIEEVSVSKTSLSVYVVTFTGAAGNTDMGAITITTQTGFTATGVTETTKGGRVGIPAGAKYALISATGADIRWRDDGVYPTATVGNLLAEDQTLWYTGDGLDKFRLIEAAASATVNVTFYQ